MRYEIHSVTDSKITNIFTFYIQLRMLVKVFGSAVSGIDATLITVEVNISQGVNFFLVGLPDSAVKESQQRIDAAPKNNGYRIPGMMITIILC
jgi:magnesium chelatase family protein